MSYNILKLEKKRVEVQIMFNCQFEIHRYFINGSRRVSELDSDGAKILLSTNSCFCKPHGDKKAHEKRQWVDEKNRPSASRTRARRVLYYHI